jgi:prepilin-type N-terminal cleavage/methylation domain-containing protein
MINKSKFVSLLRNEQGFTLIEALMAMVILVVGIFAVMGTTGTVMDKNENSRKSSIAMTLAQDKIESIKGVSQAWLLDGADGGRRVDCRCRRRDDRCRRQCGGRWLHI